MNTETMEVFFNRFNIKFRDIASMPKYEKDFVLEVAKNIKFDKTNDLVNVLYGGGKYCKAAKKKQDLYKRNKKIIKMYNNNFKVCDIAKKYRVSESTVKHIIKKNKKLITKESAKDRVKRKSLEAKKLRKEGLTIAEISYKMNCTKVTVFKYLKK